MKYKDDEYGFSFKVPLFWIRELETYGFKSTGGRIAVTPIGREAHFNISAGPPDKEEWADNKIRRNDMIKWLDDYARNIGLGLNKEEVKNFLLDGEENTIYFKHEGLSGNGRIISSFHKGIEYVIQTNEVYKELYKDKIDKIIDSFRFC